MILRDVGCTTSSALYSDGMDFSAYQVYHLLLEGGCVPFNQLGEAFMVHIYVQGSLHLSPPPLISSLLSCFPPCFQRDGIDHPIKVEDMT